MIKQIVTTIFQYFKAHQQRTKSAPKACDTSCYTCVCVHSACQITKTETGEHADRKETRNTKEVDRERETFLFFTFFNNVGQKKVKEKRVKNWVRCFVCIFFFESIKMLYRWFFTINSMNLIEYGFVIAGSKIREKKEFFMHPLFRFF